MKRIACAVALLLAAASCSSSADEPTEDDLSSVALGLCDAMSSGDFIFADSIFADRVHQGTHDLVAELEDDHRAIAAEILVAKNKVESAITDEVRFPELKQDLRALYDAVGDGLRAIDQEVPACAE